MRLLIQLLEKLPKKRLKMGMWMTSGNGDFIWPDGEGIKELKHDCRTAACGCGWAVTIPAIRKVTPDAYDVARRAFGFPADTNEHFGYESEALFGSERTCTPKQLAADIRRYLKDGTLPTS